jgi:hypothetical protein
MLTVKEYMVLILRQVDTSKNTQPVPSIRKVVPRPKYFHLRSLKNSEKKDSPEIDNGPRSRSKW